MAGACMGSSSLDHQPQFIHLHEIINLEITVLDILEMLVIDTG
jgi:hypothetical protein